MSNKHCILTRSFELHLRRLQRRAILPRPKGQGLSRKMINRPIVQTPLGVRLCRPPEVFLEISPRPLERDFVKENGERIAPNTKAHS